MSKLLAGLTLLSCSLVVGGFDAVAQDAAPQSISEGGAAASTNRRSPETYPEKNGSGGKECCDACKQLIEEMADTLRAERAAELKKLRKALLHEIYHLRKRVNELDGKDTPHDDGRVGDLEDSVVSLHDSVSD